MATYYVRTDGNNANAGTADTAAGAWLTVDYATKNSLNGVLAAGDTVYLQPGATFTERIVPDRAIYLRMRGATLDGTGGGAGTDIIGASVAVAPIISDGILANAVDRGTDLSQGGTLYGVRAQSCGGNGLSLLAGGKVTLCSARACGAGIIETGGNNPASAMVQCEAGDCTGTGLQMLRGGGFIGCLAYDCGTGAVTAHDIAGTTVIVGCTFEGNTTGLSWTGGSSQAFVWNNAFTNNTTGWTAPADISALCMADYNNFHGNTTARSNVPTGTHDTAVAPGYVNPTSDDYTLDTGSAMIGTGYSPFKPPMLVNVGATFAEVATAGGGSSYPMRL